MQPMLASEDEFYRELVRCAEVESIRAVRFSADASHADTLEDSEVSLDLKDRARHELTSERSRLRVEIDFSLKIASATDDNRQFSANITYEVVYSFSEPVSNEAKADQAVEIFARNHARYNAWPFLREFLNYASTYAELPGILLPLLKPFAKTLERGADRPPSQQA